MMNTKWFFPTMLAVMTGTLITGPNLVWRRTANAMPSDNAKDVQKGAKPNFDAQPKPREAKIVAGNRARELREKLDEPIAGIEFEPNTPLTEALAHISERFGLSILVDANGFKTDLNFDDVRNSPVRLPKLIAVKLRTVLRETLRQVEGDFYIKDDVVMVVPRKQIEAGVVLRQPIEAVIEKRPLLEALNELADISGVSIVLDLQRLKDPKLEVTGDFRNVPLNCAVKLLADMAGMKSVVMDNLIYVTSPENADKLEKEKAQKEGVAPPKWEKEKEKEKEMPKKK